MLDLIWSASFKNGQIIRQFDDEEQTKEHLFREVQNLNDELIVFSLVNVKTNRVYQVNLEHGRIHIFNPGFVIAPEAEVAGDPAHRYRLIYFRRVTRHFSGNLVEVDKPDTQYFLGYQYTKEEKNIKKMIQITPTDEVYLT